MSLLYPWSDGSIRAQDPTYGRIDHDIQWYVQSIGCEDRAQRWAIEATIQARRDSGTAVIGWFQLPAHAMLIHGVDADTHIIAMRAGFILVAATAALALLIAGIIWWALA